MKRFFLLITATMIITQLSAQTKKTSSVNQVWLGYFNQTRFNNKWGLWTDVHLRTKEEFFTNFSQAIGRIGIIHYFNDNTRLIAGYAYINHFPSDNHKEISQPEHRPWQQFQWNTKYGNNRLTQWFRLEERYRRKILNDSQLADGYSFNFRLRYNALLQVPLNKKAIEKGTLALVLNDEVHVNFGKQIVYNYFDQNRLFGGFSYYVNSHDNIQFGYMNIFQQLAAGNQYRTTHSARIFYFHNLDLRGKH